MAITDEMVKKHPGWAHLSWPYLSLRLDNANAVYRVETLDRGVWHGERVDGWVHLEG